MTSLSSLREETYNPILETKVKGFANIQNLDKENYFEGYVMKGMEYRPDLIAQYYLGDSELAWVITMFNSFTLGIEDYTLGRKLKIPR